MPNIPMKTVTLKGNTYEIVDDYARNSIAELVTSTGQLATNKADASTTLDGYGITDAYTKAEVDSAVNVKADSSDVGDIANLNTASNTSVVSALNDHEGRISNMAGRIDAIEYVIENIGENTGNIADITTLRTFAQAVYDGTVLESMSIGDQLEIEWVDGNETYNSPWFFCHAENAELENGDIIPVADIEWEFTIPHNIPFDTPEAIYESSSTLPAGTYYFIIASDPFGPDTQKYVQFTLPEDLPAGYQIRKSAARGESVFDGTLDIHTGAGSTNKQYSVTPIEGYEGTFLGTTDGTGDLNTWTRVTLGDSRWRYSDIRQYLNRNEGRGVWWTKQKKWDVKPACVNQVSGFLHGYNSGVLAYLQETKVVTAYPQGNTDVTYDKVFLSSLGQMNILPEYQGIEGDPWVYYEQLLESSSPVSRGTPRSRLIKYSIDSQSEAQNYPLRSVSASNSNGVWTISTDGSSGTYYIDKSNFRPVPCARVSLPEAERI